MVTLLLTKPFTDSPAPQDDAARWAVLRERTLRELSWRKAGECWEDTEPVSLLHEIPATDAGHVCHECGRIVSWTDHLPPLHAGGPVRCFVNGDRERIVNGAGQLLALVAPANVTPLERTPDSTPRQLLPGGKPC
jgi:hypothetical protein